MAGILAFGGLGPSLLPPDWGPPAWTFNWLYDGLTLGLALALTWSFIVRGLRRRPLLGGTTEIAVVVYVAATGIAIWHQFAASWQDYAVWVSRGGCCAGSYSGGDFIEGVILGSVCGPIIGLAFGAVEVLRGRIEVGQILAATGLGLLVVPIVPMLWAYWA